MDVHLEVSMTFLSLRNVRVMRTLNAFIPPSVAVNASTHAHTRPCVLFTHACQVSRRAVRIQDACTIHMSPAPPLRRRASANTLYAHRTHPTRHFPSLGAHTTATDRGNVNERTSISSHGRFRARRAARARGRRRDRVERTRPSTGPIHDRIGVEYDSDRVCGDDDVKRGGEG